MDPDPVGADNSVTSRCLLAAILAFTFLACWIAYLVFLLRLVGKTGKSESVVHAAIAFRAGPGGLFTTLGKIFRRGG